MKSHRSLIELKSIIARIHGSTYLDISTVKVVVEKVFECMIDDLKSGKKVKMSNLGTLRPNMKNRGQGRSSVRLVFIPALYVKKRIR
jgi:nucleoid DNA-binding protein